MTLNFSNFTLRIARQALPGRRFLWGGLATLALCLFPVWCAAEGVPIDLGSWDVVQYEDRFQPDASWVLSEGNTVATQTVNADPSMLLSDFGLTADIIDGSWIVETAGDDDFMGFVFGYQDRGQFYLFDWKQRSQSHRGFAEQGMTVKVVDMPADTDPTGNDLWPTAGGANVAQLFHNTIPWADRTLYDFNLEFLPGSFTIEVREGDSVLMSETIEDGTYTSGKFGFYNYSQDQVRYQGFTREEIPEPCTLVLLTMGALASTFGYLRRSRRQ